MIHYTCDLCKREICSGDEIRYVVKLETYAALEPLEATDSDDDRDHLEEIQDLLQDLDGEADELDIEPAHRQFDLCRDCYRKFIRNPLGRDLAQALHFSEN